MKTILFNVSYLLEVEDELLLNTNEGEKFNDLVCQKLAKFTRKKIDDSHTANWNHSSLIVLDSNKMNCGKCCKCGSWTTDREKAGFIEGLSNGASIEDELFCDECLPKNHRWSF